MAAVEMAWDSAPTGAGGAAAGDAAEAAAPEAAAFSYPALSFDAPPLRVCQEDVPLPYAANLEALSLPSVDKIVKAVHAVCYR